MGAPLAAVALASAVGAVYVGLLATGRRVGPLKPMPALILAATAPTWTLSAAFACCALGDALLLDKQRWLLHGLGAFLVGHLAFGVGLAAGPPPVGLVLAVAAGVVVALIALRRGLRGRLAVAVPVYAVVLGVMVVAASTRGAVGLAGGLLFLVSDAWLGWTLFGGHGRPRRRIDDVAVMATYVAALVVLAIAAH